MMLEVASRIHWMVHVILGVRTVICDSGDFRISWNATIFADQISRRNNVSKSRLVVVSNRGIFKARYHVNSMQ